MLHLNYLLKALKIVSWIILWDSYIHFAPNVHIILTT